jgi:hypothetical protein
MNYEISLEAMRVDGGDFFCGLTFPVDKSPCSFIVGGWGGGVVGLSCIDGYDASENATTRYREFKNGQWYRIRVRVTPSKIEAWIDDEKMVDATTTGREISIRPEVERSRPLGIASWCTTAAVRTIQVRRVDAPDSPPERPVESHGRVNRAAGSIARMPDAATRGRNVPTPGATSPRCRQRKGTRRH